MASVPMPQPISSTRLPAQRSNWANPGICDSTKYLRASTSSKYSLEPISALEWRILHGRRSQYACTAAILAPDGADVAASTDVISPDLSVSKGVRPEQYHKVRASRNRQTAIAAGPANERARESPAAMCQEPRRQR